MWKRFNELHANRSRQYFSFYRRCGVLNFVHVSIRVAIKNCDFSLFFFIIIFTRNHEITFRFRMMHFTHMRKFTKKRKMFLLPYADVLNGNSLCPMACTSVECSVFTTIQLPVLCNMNKCRTRMNTSAKIARERRTQKRKMNALNDVRLLDTISSRIRESASHK